MKLSVYLSLPGPGGKNHPLPAVSWRRSCSVWRVKWNKICVGGMSRLLSSSPRSLLGCDSKNVWNMPGGRRVSASSTWELAPLSGFERLGVVFQVGSLTHVYAWSALFGFNIRQGVA